VSIFTKIFGGGEAPEEYVALAGDSSTLFHTQGVPMTGRAVQLHSPNRRASKSITAHRNARIVITKAQLIVWIGRRLRCHATFTTDDAAPLLLSLRTDGLTIDVDVAKALPPKGSGTLQLTGRLQIPSAALGQLASHHLRATAPEADLLSMTRWV
jgi:hypothetical protein